MTATPSATRSLRLRLAVGAVGGLGVVYGAFLVLTDQRDDHPRQLAKWMIATVVVHDGVLVPTTMAIGWLVARIFRTPARRYVQAALIVGGLVTAVATLLIYRRGKAAPGQSLEGQDYAAHLWFILGCVAAVALVGYLTSVLRTMRRRGRSGHLPDDVDGSAH